MADLAEIYQFPTVPRRSVSVNSWRWNEIEDEALLALPPEIERLYLHGIRKHMDYATGVAGIKRRVSMDMFLELLEYHPPAGSREKARLYSRQQITRMLDKLEDAGLIVRLHRGKGVKAPMEFRLPMACSDDDQQRADSEPRGASRKNPHGRASGAGNSEQGASREERATSGSPVTPTSLPSGESVAAPKSSKRRQWGEPIDHELAEWMAGVVDALPGGSEKRSLTAWANTLRLMREQDGREPEHIKRLFEWASQHDFWQANVLSPAKLRKQWKTLALQYNRDRNGASNENRHSTDSRRTERDRIAASLADPYDASWSDGLFDEGGAQGSDPVAGEPGIHPHGGDISPHLEGEFYQRGDDEAVETGARAVDGELVFAAASGASRHGY